MAQDFILGVIGDFSGARDVASERFVEVDRDDWDAVFARHAPRLSPGLPFCDELHLETWDDWHPDALVDLVPSFGALLAAREAASDPKRTQRLLQQAGVELPGAEPAAGAPAPRSAPEPVPESALLDDLLSGKGSDAPVRVARPASDPGFERMLREIAEPHAIRVDHARVQAWRDAIDAEIGARLRALLGHPEVCRSEASWRSLRSLVWGTETGEQLRIRLLDLPAEALETADPASLGLHRLVVDEVRDSLGGQPFGLLLADYAIGARDADLVRLGTLARVAEDAAVPCIAGAAASLWRPEAAQEAQKLLERARALPGAQRIGLCAPRVLVRLPYGPGDNPVDRFHFAEVDDATDASGYLWGNAAYALAQAATESVAATGRPNDAPRFAERRSLPLHPRDAGEAPIGPTEELLTDADIERLRSAGLVPLAGVRGRDSAVVMAFQSLTGDRLFAG